MKYQKKSRTLLVVGGARSGKSDMALRWAEAQDTRRTFIATARVEDGETARRVERHQLERGVGWETLEAPLDIMEALQKGAQRGGVLVLDCITMWLSNLMAEELGEQQILERVEALAEWLLHAPVPVVVVSTELGMGVVPMTPVGRHFRDIQGESNQILAGACRDVLLASCGLSLALKGQVPEVLR